MEVLDKMTTKSLNDTGWRLFVDYWGHDPKLSWRLDIAPKNGIGHACADMITHMLEQHPALPITGDLALGNGERTGGSDTNWNGGIKFGIFTYTLNSCNRAEKGVAQLRVAFSSSRVYTDVDLCITLAVIKTINETFASLHPEVYTHYDWDTLRNDSTIGFYMNLLGM
jgi:hypothetical protein